MLPGFTHDGLQEDLADHLRGNTDRMVWTNLQLGPSGSPRPDVFTLDKSYARFSADCYEIKVSLADLRSDVTSGKWQSYRKYGHRVWFAFQRGMAPLDLIPRECGVILRSDAGWRAARKPVAQVMDTLPRDTWLKLVIESHPRPSEAMRITALRDVDRWKAADLARKKLGAELGEMFSNVGKAAELLEYRKSVYDSQIKDIAEQLEASRARARESEAQWRTVLDDCSIELGVALGLKREEVTLARLSSAIQNFRTSLKGHAVARAISSLQALTGELETPL